MMKHTIGSNKKTGRLVAEAKRDTSERAAQQMAVVQQPDEVPLRLREQRGNRRPCSWAKAWLY
jgi:hypothetical protein